MDLADSDSLSGADSSGDSELHLSDDAAVAEEAVTSTEKAPGQGESHLEAPGPSSGSILEVPARARRRDNGRTRSSTRGRAAASSGTASLWGMSTVWAGSVAIILRTDKPA